MAVDAQNKLVAQNCASCHSEKMKAGQLVLAGFDAAAMAALWREHRRQTRRDVGFDNGGRLVDCRGRGRQRFRDQRLDAGRRTMPYGAAPLDARVQQYPFDGVGEAARFGLDARAGTASRARDP